MWAQPAGSTAHPLLPNALIDGILTTEEETPGDPAPNDPGRKARSNPNLLYTRAGFQQRDKGDAPILHHRSVENKSPARAR